MMPGNSSSPFCNRRRKLSRISCLTVLETHPLSRSSFRLAGRTLAGISPFSPCWNGSVANGCSSAKMLADEYFFIVDDGIFLGPAILELNPVDLDSAARLCQKHPPLSGNRVVNSSAISRPGRTGRLEWADIMATENVFSAPPQPSPPTPGARPPFRHLWQVPIFLTGLLTLAAVWATRPLWYDPETRQLQLE